MSSDLYWMIIRNNNAYLLKKRDIKKPFSTVSIIYFQKLIILAFVTLNNVNVNRNLVI